MAGSEDVLHFCCRIAEYPAEAAAKEKRRAIQAGAGEIRRMHDLGIQHADLHLKNILLCRSETGGVDAYVIDFDRARARESLTMRQRLANLRRLARSLRKLHLAGEVFTARDRLRFLRAYLRGLPEAGKTLRLWARKLAGAGASHELWWAATRARRTPGHWPKKR